MNILIVDDEETILDIVAFELGELGHAVTLANSGNRAIEKIKATNVPFDIILSDALMPDGKGLDVLNYLKKNNISSRFILMSGFAETTEKNALELGAFAFVKKPFDLEKLGKLISDVGSSLR